MDADEDVALARARRGDADAYRTLVRAHQDAAVRLAATVSGSWDDPEAIVQEAFVKAFHTLDRFRAGAPFRPWLLTIVANEARNARRGAQRRWRRVQRVAGRDPGRTHVPSPENDVIAADEQRRLLAALERLPARQRETVACRYLLELSEAETADVLNVARGTVKSRLSRALRALRDDLATVADPISGGDPR